MDIWELRAAELEEKQQRRKRAHQGPKPFWTPFEKQQQKVIDHYRAQSTSYGQIKPATISQDGSSQGCLF